MEDGEFRHLKGLLYFTDGDGIYPDVEPDRRRLRIYQSEIEKGEDAGLGI